MFCDKKFSTSHAKKRFRLTRPSIEEVKPIAYLKSAERHAPYKQLN
jgi:hypothetical protein